MRRTIHICKACWQYCAEKTLASWRILPAPRPHPAARSLDLPLQPLPVLRWLSRLYLCSICLYAGQLLLTGHPVVAVITLLLGAAIRFALRQVKPAGPEAPRRLMVAADGRLHVATISGQVMRVELGGESLWLGSAALLVLHAGGSVHRLFLGAGNLEPAQLAALRRRLRAVATVSAKPAVDSPPGSQSANTIEQFMRR